MICSEFEVDVLYFSMLSLVKRMGLVDCHTSEIIVEIPQKKVLPCMDTVKIITRESDVTNTCYLISFSTTISVIYV